MLSWFRLCCLASLLPASSGVEVSKAAATLTLEWWICWGMWLVGVHLAHSAQYAEFESLLRKLDGEDRKEVR